MPEENPVPNPPPSARLKLLDAAIELMAAEGGTGWTLRRLAERLGTSHRMVIYHFGSLEGLLTAVVLEVEARQRARRVDLTASSDDPIEGARTMWRELSSPDVAAHERLFFELYAAGLQGHEYAAPLVDSAMNDWLQPLTEAFTALSGDAEQSAVDARLGMAVVRGLLLDVLATGDHAAATQAHERYLQLYQDLLPSRESATARRGDT